MKTRGITIRILSFLFLFGAACKSSDKNEEKLFQKVSELAAKMKFSRLTVDFGKVPKDTMLVAKFDFVNSGTDSLFINYVAPDCSCTGYQLSKDRLAPNEKGYVLLKMSTKEQIGSVDVSSTVCANTKAKFYNLQILADVN